MSISFTGIGSGVQVSEIVDAIVNAERVPFQSRLNQREGRLTTDISAVGALKSALEKVQQSMTKLGDVDEFQKRTISGNDDFVSLSSDKEAQPGGYAVKVNNLAAQHKLSSAAVAEDDAVGEGKLTFSSGTETFDIDVTSSMTMDEISQAINDSDDNDSITATIITDDTGQHLVLTAKNTGLDNAIKIVVDDTGDSNNTDSNGLSRLAYDSDPVSATYAENLSQVTAAADASITIDNSITITSDTNKFENVISGVTVTAKKAHGTDDDDSSINVKENNSNIRVGLNGFIESYNELVELAGNLGRAGEAGSGPMAGDSLLRGVMSKLRQELTNTVELANGDSLSLSQLGVSVDRYGKASLDSERLKEQVDKDVNVVQTFFTGSDSNGFANSFDELMSFYTDTDGLIQNRIESKQSQLDGITDERVAFGRKMESLESRLLAQYNSMDLLVANLKSTSNYVQAQLDNMPGVVKQSK